MLREPTVSIRQFFLFGVVVIFGLFFTVFIAREVYNTSVSESRGAFRVVADRFLDDIVVGVLRPMEAATNFRQLTTVAGAQTESEIVGLLGSYEFGASDHSTAFAARQVFGNDLGEDGDILIHGSDRSANTAGGSVAADILVPAAVYGGQSAGPGDTRLAALGRDAAPGLLAHGTLLLRVPLTDGTPQLALLQLINPQAVVADAVDVGNMVASVDIMVAAALSGDSAGAQKATVTVSPPAPAADVPSDGAWQHVRTISAAGQTLRFVAFAGGDAYRVDPQPALRAALIGLAFTSLLAILVYGQIRRSSRVVEIVNRRTRALKEAHSELESHYKLLQNLNSDVDEARKAAEAANLAKSEFLATMSHELRTPLNAILGFSEILESETLGPIGDRRYVDYAKDIHNSGKHLLSIINDILDLAKLEAGRIEIERVPLNPRVLAARVVGLLSHQAEEKELTFTTDIADSMPGYILGDELRLRQVLINLASNAIKFTSTGTVTIRMLVKAFKNGRAGWVLEVEDTGIGIPEDKQSILFDRFTQVDTTHSRRHGGVGLGLAICRELVDRMDGIISVRSIQNVGTTIRVQLPLDEASEEDDHGALI